MKLFPTSVVLFVVTFFAPLAMGSPDWTNSGPDTNWDNGLNWTTAVTTGVVPGPGDSAHIFPGFITFADLTNSQITVTPGGKKTITINAPSNENVGSLLVSSNFTGLLTTNIAATVPNGVLNLTEAPGLTFTIGTGGEVVTGTSILNFTGNQSVSGDVIVGVNFSPIDPGQVTGTGVFNFAAGTLNMDLGTGNSLLIGDGAAGTFNQGSGTIVKTGQNVVIGDGASGTYTVATGSVIDIGDQANPASNGYLFEVGGGTGGAGILTLNGTAALNALNPGTEFAIGDAVGTIGTVNQNDTATVNIGGDLFAIGVAGTGIYNLNGGALNVSSTFFDIGEQGNGTLIQNAGSLTVTNGLVIGDGIANTIGSGTYALFGGTANITGGLVIGNNEAGLLLQRGGALISSDVAIIGLRGVYALSGGTANLNGGLILVGQVLQTGGIMNIPAGQTIDLSTVGSIYSLAGGTLRVANGTLVGTNGEGKLNFGGGTLQITNAGAFTDPLDGVLLGTSNIDALTTAGVTSVTMSGDLSGAGGLNLLGTAGTVFNLSGADTFTGVINLPAGTLNIAGNSIAATSALKIGATGIVNLTLDAGGLAYPGALSGAGLLNVDFNAGGPLVLLNTAGLTGTIALGTGGAAGTLQLYNGSLTGISGAGSNVTIGGAALAALPMGVVAPTSGTVNMQGATYTGLTTISNRFVLNTTGLGGALVNDGTIAVLPSVAVGTPLAVGGSFTQDPTGIFHVRTNGATADVISATSANLNGKILVSGVATSTPMTYNIVTTTGGLTTGALNDPAGLSTLSSFLLGATLVLNGNDLQLTVVRNPIVGQTPNQIAVANVLNASPLNPIFAAINNNLTLTAADAPAILEQLSPASVQYVRIISFESSNLLAIRMDNVSADLRAGYGGLDTNAISVASPGFNSGLGRSMHNFFASNTGGYHTAAPNGVNYYSGGAGTAPSSGGSAAIPAEEVPTFEPSSQLISDTPNPYLANQYPSGPEVPKLSEFIGGDVVLADLNQDHGAVNAPAAKASYTAGDAVVGASYRVTPHLAAGVLFDYNHTDAKTDDNGSKIKVDSYSPGIFGTWFDHGFYVNGLASFGYNTYSNTRSISFIGEKAASSPSGQQYVGNIDGGYDFHPTKNWVVGPTLGVTYTHLDVDSYSETGSPSADLSVDSQSVDSLRSRFGAHAVYQTNTGDVLLQPNLSIMWQHEYLDDADGITSRFSNFSADSFTVDTVAPGRDSALISLGLTATLSSSMALYLNYIADVGSNEYWAQSVVGGFKARF